MLARSLLLLYFATNIPTFRSCGIEIDGSVYFSLYGLVKVAESFTKSGPFRQATHDDNMIITSEKAYATMSEKGLVNLKRMGPTTYVTITLRGNDLSRKLVDQYRDW